MRSCVELVPPPSTRTKMCVGPCARCGAGGERPRLSGAVLAPAVRLSAGQPLAHLGLWLTIPADARSLRLSVLGDALGFITLTSARLHGADADRQEQAPWSAAPFTNQAKHGVWLRPPAHGITVLSLVGIAHAPGEGVLSFQLMASRGGCLFARVDVSVRTMEPTGFDVAYLALDGANPTRLLRWIDASAAALVRAGHWRTAVWMRAATVDSGFEGAARVDAVGVDGACWSRVRAALTRGELTFLSLGDRAEPARAGIELVLGGPCEASVWARGDDRALRDAWWRAAAVGAPATLQALVGRLHEPVSPRVVTAWERARGVRSLPCEARWLERFVRAPGEKVYCRGQIFLGEEARACWPGHWGVS